jgi:hypothetical protein
MVYSSQTLDSLSHNKSTGERTKPKIKRKEIGRRKEREDNTVYRIPSQNLSIRIASQPIADAPYSHPIVYREPLLY